MRMPWWTSYRSLRPRRIAIVSSTDGSPTNTGWKRRSNAASFSMCLRYSSSVVGATTLDEYRKPIEKDAALERRFQPVFVGEPSVEDTIAILRGLKERYEVHHG